jgi:hypothetical protein
MTRQIINVGMSDNDRKGDSLRAAFQKVNANFTELYTQVENISIGSVSWNNVADKPTFATVATSGSYNDLINKPNIPADISDLTDNQGLLADSFDGGGAASEYNEEQTIDGGGA